MKIKTAASADPMVRSAAHLAVLESIASRRTSANKVNSLAQQAVMLQVRADGLAEEVRQIAARPINRETFNRGWAEFLTSDIAKRNPEIVNELRQSIRVR